MTKRLALAFAVVFAGWMLYQVVRGGANMAAQVVKITERAQR